MAKKKYGNAKKMREKKKEQAVAKAEKKLRKTNLFPHINIFLLVFYAVVMAAIIVISYSYLNVPIIPLCTIAVLEGLLGVLLCRIAAIKYWYMHVFPIALQLVCGFLVDRGIFMVLMCVIYAFTLVVMWVQRRTLK